MAPPVVHAAPVPPQRQVTSPYAEPLDADADAVRARLEAVVRAHGLDPTNPWAVGHALVGLGGDAALPDGGSAVDHLFAAFAERVPGGVAFPRSRGSVRIEPHAGLTLKVLTDVGVPPTRAVTVQGAPATVADLWTGALATAWVDGAKVWTGTWNDTPWVLQGLSAWAPPGLSWTTGDGHTTDLDGWTHASVVQLEADTAFLAEARDRGTGFEKRRQGIFAYTCGGAHLLQGTAAAVARGFGEPEDRARMDAQARLQIYRFGPELAQVDALVARAPEHRLLLMVQRLKFTGHHLETLHRFAAWGLVPAEDAQVRASMADAQRELIQTVHALEAMGVFDRMAEVRLQSEQIYLDLVGDGAHALRALNLASGAASLGL